MEGLCLSCDISEEIEVEIDVDSDRKPIAPPKPPKPAPPKPPPPVRAAPRVDVDPLIGRVIADRYEIRALHGTGGMARVYRAMQRSLEREVIVKVISPELLAQEDSTADEAVARFMVEAQAASKLNHPNVVSVFDFGRTAKSDGGLLFLVMEYLTGSDLWSVQREDGAMPIPRVANILEQVLGALGEAHYVGIAHRDIKPENIIIEPTRGGRDLVKVIDFGLAKFGALRSVTRIGQTVGTPSYMAPEQIAGSAIGSSDLYAVGVMLFELLTGQLPFSGTPLQILRKHLSDRRPDPRDVAPNRGISAELAAVCIRAMHIDPAQRWPDAESLAEAIVKAAGSTQWNSRKTVPRMGAATGPAAIRNTAPTAPLPIARGHALVARDADLAWAKKLLTSPDGLFLSLHGPAGSGRTRLLAEISAEAETRGSQVIRFRAPPFPRREVTFGALHTLIPILAGLARDEPTLSSGEAADPDAGAAAGLLAIFGGILQSAKETRASVGLALRWALGRATARGVGSLVVTIDDLDEIDNASRAAFLDAMATPLPECFIVATSHDPLPVAGGRGVTRPVLGLSLADAKRMMEGLGGATDGPLARRTDDTIEPLYVELLRRYGLAGPDSKAPLRLEDLVASGLAVLKPAQRRVLLAVALTGGGPIPDVGALVRSDDAKQALTPLVDAGILETDADGVRVAHEVFARIATATTPGGAVLELHQAAADKLVGDPFAVELRTYHALLAGPDFETFMLVEDTATLRAGVGDDDGAVDVLAAAVRSARTMLRHGDVEAGGSACVVFGQKLGSLLRELGRHEEAVRVLDEALAVAAPDDARRVKILEDLARSGGALGRLADSERWRREALTIARKRDDRVAVQRLVALARE